MTLLTQAQGSRGPIVLVPVAVVVFLTMGLGPNSLLALLSLVVLLVGAFLLWRPGEIPILLFIFSFQWLQASAALFYGNWQGLGVDELTKYGGRQELATVLVLSGLLFLAIGMRLAAGAPESRHVQLARRMLLAYPSHRWLQIYLAACVAAVIARSLAALMPGLSQLLLGIADLRGAAYFLFTYATFVRRDSSKAIWAAVFLIEFVISVGGYFSGFGSLFFYTLFALVASKAKVTAKQMIFAIAFAICLSMIAVVWTTVKVDYRNFVSGGERAQVVTVGYRERISKLIELVSDLTANDLVDGMKGMVERISYVEYFGVTLDYVPSFMAHEYGGLWLDAITRPLMPRYFFPDKSVIDESELTSRYTGVTLAGTSEGTSISLGYMTESYIDFGEIGMMPAIFMLGLALGRLYRWIIHAPYTRGPLGMALAGTTLMPAAQLEASTAKIVGGLFAAVFAAWVVAKFIVPYLALWLRADKFECSAVQQKLAPSRVDARNRSA